MRSRTPRAGMLGLVALAVLFSGAIAVTAGPSPLEVGRVAQAAPATSEQVPPAFSVDQCVDELGDDTLPPAAREAQRRQLGPICETILAALPDLGQSGYSALDFALCANQAAGKRATGPGPALTAAIKQCTEAASPEAIAACQASVARLSGDANAGSLCKFIYQGTPLGVSSGEMLACLTAQYALSGLTGADDPFEVLDTCYQQLATDAAAERAIQQAMPSVTTSLAGAEECLRRIGAGTSPTDTAEARCAFILQAAPAGIDLNALASCIGGAADFQEAYRRCVERLATATCTQWDISGTWQTSQGNGYRPTFTFQQSGTRITGTATLPGGEAQRAGFTSSSGAVSGALVGDQLDVTVTWSGQRGPVVGRYRATIAGGGLTNGDAGGVSWTGTGPARCLN